MTQSEIAERLGLTRRRVNEMLSEAKESGIVSIKFNAALGDCVAAEQQLCEKFDLEGAVVVPTPQDPSLLHQIVGRAAAGFLQRRIVTSRATRIGVGWGATLREMIRAGDQMNLPDTKVYSVIGGLPQGAEINTFETVRGLANLLGGECEYLIAPVYADTARARETLLEQTWMRKAFENLASLDIAVVTVGDVTGKSLQIRYGLPNGVSASDLTELGAVGDIIGRYLDVTGKEIDHPIRDLVISPRLEDWLRISSRLIVSGGAHKHRIMRACAERGHATSIVTDLDCARFMLSNG